MVGLLGLECPDVATPRKITFASSLRGFRPALVNAKTKYVAWRGKVPFYAALRPGVNEAPYVERESLNEASISFQRQSVGKLVTVGSPFAAADPVSYPVGNVWFGLGIGILLSAFCQFLVAKWKNGSKPQALVRQARPVTSSSVSSTPVEEDGETIEWVNMCWRKIWRVYQQGLEKWLAGVLQRVFNKVVNEGSVPRILKGIQIMELTFDHQAPYFTNLRRRTSRKDSDLNGVVDVRYTGGARMLLMLEVGGGRWLMKVPVLVSDLDLECQLWLKVRLAPLTPYLGTLSFAFMGAPNIKVQLAPYNSVRLMRIPVLQNFLTRLLTKVLPGLMVLPRRLEINIPPAITAVAEAAVGRDAVMKAVASAVLQADALEQSLLAVLPLGPQSAAGGITLPKSFQGELSVALIQGRDLPVWGFPWQSNPFCRLTLGKQAVLSKRENDTGTKGGHRRPIWNQEFEFLVENLQMQTLEVYIKDSPITGRPEVGKVEFPLNRLPKDGSLSIWLPVQQVNPGQKPAGELHLDISYKAFVDEDVDSGYINAGKYAKQRANAEEEEITDIKSAAAASSKAAAAASAAFSAIAITRAAAARAAHRAQTAAMAATKIAQLGSGDDDDGESDLEDEEVGFDPDTYDMEEMQVEENGASQNGAESLADDEAEAVEMLQAETSVLPQFSGDTRLNGDVDANGSTPSVSNWDQAPEVEIPQLLATQGMFEREPPDSRLPEEGHPSAETSPLAPLPDSRHSAAAENGSVLSSDVTADVDTELKPWWTDVVRRRPESEASLAEAAAAEAPRPKKRNRIRWWMWLTASVAFWRRKPRSSSPRADLAIPPPPKAPEDEAPPDTTDSVVLPRELPIEEIAKEVVRLRSVSDKDEKEKMHRLYSAAVERSDRKWIMLLCFLIVLSIGMLSIVAVRIGPI